MARKVKEYYASVELDERGTFLSIPIISKGKSYEILIDTKDFERFKQYNWTVLYRRGEANYLKRRVSVGENGDRGKIELLHRFVMKVYGDVHLDHIDGNGFNCRTYNLRVATSAQNAQNCKSRKNTSSKYKGVGWCKVGQKWVARIRYQGKLHHVGRYEKEIVDGEDKGEIRAARRYDEEAIKRFGSFARLNFPDERNVSTIKDGRYKMSFLLNEQEKKKIESEIVVMSGWSNKDLNEFLGRKTVNGLMDLCHYYGCGVSELVREISQGVLSDKVLCGGVSK